EAARRYAGEGAEFVGFPDIHAVISAVSHSLVDQAVAPIENSIEGSINVTVDQLIHGKNPPRIAGELNLPVRHHLVGRPGTTISDVERVVSIPAAIAQCRQFLLEHLPQVQILPALSTSAAVSSLVHSDRIAAVGNDRAARLYGMEIIASDIQDADDNVTRFAILGRGPTEATGHDKTSICCSIAADFDQPGSLVAILGEFAGRDINLSKLESRPTRGGLGKYFFLIDLVGHETDPAVAEALAGLRLRCSSVMVLGSYPASEVLS
ncbi:MAG TPA: prephenate dehydratase, partial [Candidatus Dormibacteraeota bacterium]|nr:prephenate dehydratase [Candidatus Dormibacteraeota bacterium]